MACDIGSSVPGRMPESQFSEPAVLFVSIDVQNLSYLTTVPDTNLATTICSISRSRYLYREDLPVDVSVPAVRSKTEPIRRKGDVR